MCDGRTGSRRLNVPGRALSVVQAIVLFGLVDSSATDESPVCACVCAVNAVCGVSDLDDGTWIGRTWTDWTC